MQIADLEAYTPDVSPDGSMLTFASLDDQNRTMIVVCELPSCAKRRTLVPPELVLSLGVGARIRWTPDSKAIAYVRGEAQQNLWLQPLDGSPPRQFTHFGDARSILDFAWSRSGDRLAIARATRSTDVVLFRGVRKPS